ncbi:hypothetical protein EUA06_13085 [Nocardioides glacieisoli]|jgi:hypothetical protein|uniref:DUF5667 domain-containing protein n=1 Tax=Nocardioides glacieisoli TaxID=1168730 RepID=A0A4V1RJX5_9ACTN|nr:DUF5667 domain-containing protein [Nocardioides glacieisoli]RYB90302.1 hypothetical protein EUA06_13085 [Nocardioides glacieisoli]
MTSAFSARRRADEFEALLTQSPGAPLTDREAARYAELVALVSDLRALPEVAPRAEFVGSLRERLMAEADTVLVRQPPAPQRLAMPSTTRPRDRRLATLLGGAALVGATATMAVAAQTSLPGESLYGVKRGIESAQVRLADDDAARGRTLLAQAETRLTELEELAAGTGGTEQLIPDTLDSFTEQSGEGVRSLLTSYGSGGSDADVQVARAFTSTSMDRLDALQGTLPDSASDELLAAGRTLTDLDTEISTACGLCDGALTTTPDFLNASAAIDLVQGLDVDELTLETVPVSGQDVTGITIPKALQSPQQVLPDPSVTPTSVVPTTAPTLLPGTPTPTPTVTPTKGVDPTKPVKDVTTTVTNTTSNLTTQLNGVTGGAVGGLTGAVDDATGGLIGEVTGTLDGATGGLLGNATGGLLP